MPTLRRNNSTAGHVLRFGPYISMTSNIFDYPMFESIGSTPDPIITSSQTFENLKRMITKMFDDNRDATSGALKVLDLLQEKVIIPDFVNKSNEDSILIEFFRNGYYYLIESFNDGDIVVLRRNNKTKERLAFDTTVDNISSIISSIL